MDRLTYAAYNKDEYERINSSSGGMFVLMARYILNCGGAVYGVAMTPECDAAKFIRVSDVENLAVLMSSKYMQAKLGNTFNLVKMDLEQGFFVLFTGTGCQINGLKSFLNKSYDKLYCVDIVCHGTPSPKLWKKYIVYIEKKYHSKVKTVNFRCKDTGWNDAGLKKIPSSKNQIFIPRKIDPYMRMFLTNLSLRPSCYECAAKTYRLSDMSIADFWGIETIAPKLNDNKGISMVIIRNTQGKQLFDNIKSKMIYEEVSYKDAIENNYAEYSSVYRPYNRGSFFLDLNQMQFDDLAKKYVFVSFKRKVKSYLLNSPLKFVCGGKSKVSGNDDYGIFFVLDK